MFRITKSRTVTSKLLRERKWKEVYIHTRTDEGHEESIYLAPIEIKKPTHSFIAKAKVNNGRFTIPKRIFERGWTPGTPYAFGGSPSGELYIMKFPPNAFRFVKKGEI